MIDASLGSTVASYEYSAFGALLKSEGSSASNNLIRFSSKYWDAECDMLYFGQRYYSPGTGRWLTRDPYGEDGGSNLYGFVGNDAINYIDPDGEYKWDYSLNSTLVNSFSSANAPDNALGITTAKRPSVSCQDGILTIKFSISVEVLNTTAVARVYPNSNADRVSARAQKDEQQHVADLLLWKEQVASPLAEAYENKNPTSKCCDLGLLRLQSLLIQSFNDTEDETHKFWDGTTTVAHQISLLVNPNSPHHIDPDGRSASTPSGEDLSAHNAIIKQLYQTYVGQIISNSN